MPVTALGNNDDDVRAQARGPRGAAVGATEPLKESSV
jgi:hypothetical protein